MNEHYASIDPRYISAGMVGEPIEREWRRCPLGKSSAGEDETEGKCLWARASNKLVDDTFQQGRGAELYK